MVFEDLGTIVAKVRAEARPLSRELATAVEHGLEAFDDLEHKRGTLMIKWKHRILLATASSLIFVACSAYDVDPANRDLIEEAIVEHESLERKLDLVPQVANAADLAEAGSTLNGNIPRFLILSNEAGAIDLDSIAISDEGGSARRLTELFFSAPRAHVGPLERDALLLLAVPEDSAEELCERFQFAHDDADLSIGEQEQLLFLAGAPDGRTHALCLLPTATEDAGQDAITDPAAKNAPPSFGSGTYTVHVKSLKCNDPRDWENWPYNGDEARLRAFYDGMGGGQIWGSNNVKSGKIYYPERYIHFNNNAKLELYDYDSGLWNANDKLGQEWIYPGEACGGDHYGDFDGNGGGHNWNYDLTYRVYGPNCPCQSQVPAIYSYSQVETCTVTSSTITSYTYYCSGGIYWRQAWGNVTRHCQTFNKTYNTSCEMNTFVSQTLVSECDKYQSSVAIGSPTQVGTCPNPDPCDPPQVDGDEAVVHVPSLIDPICQE